jgi:hypothetical protein
MGWKENSLKIGINYFGGRRFADNQKSLINNSKQVTEGLEVPVMCAYYLKFVAWG